MSAETKNATSRRHALRLSLVTAEVLHELNRAVELLPTWPSDPLHALAVLGEEFGELTKATLQSVYEPHKAGPKDVRTEAVQTAAMALRFLLSLDALQYRWVLRADQHVQGDGGAKVPNAETRAAMGEADAIVAARRGDTLGFGAALFAMKQGQRVRRACWTGGLFMVLDGGRICASRDVEGWQPHMTMPGMGDVLAEDWEVLP